MTIDDTEATLSNKIHNLHISMLHFKGQIDSLTPQLRILSARFHRLLQQLELYFRPALVQLQDRIRQQNQEVKVELAFFQRELGVVGGGVERMRGVAGGCQERVGRVEGQVGLIDFI